jgi:hypothetical protein
VPLVGAHRPYLGTSHTTSMLLPDDTIHLKATSYTLIFMGMKAVQQAGTS